jgi:polyisoprenoid-binding protein YceI
MNRYVLLFTIASLGSALLAGCGDEKTTIAPTAEGSALPPSLPRSTTARRFVIDPATSKVGFAMEAPLEKIRGKVDDGTTGEIWIDPADLTQTSGNIVVDISKLELFQRVKDENTNDFADEKKNATQNGHARQWLEIDNSSPPDLRQRFSRVEFAIRSITEATPKDVTKLGGAERKVTVKAKGDFLLHGRMQPKEVTLDVTFTYDGDKPTAITVKTVEPFKVGLAEFEVRPRTRFGVLAEKTLDVMAPKVARDAPVQIELHATLEGAPPPSAPPPAPSFISEPSASASSAVAPSAAPSGAPPTASSTAPASSGSKK